MELQWGHKGGVQQGWKGGCKGGIQEDCSGAPGGYNRGTTGGQNEVSKELQGTHSGTEIRGCKRSATGGWWGLQRGCEEAARVVQQGYVRGARGMPGGFIEIEWGCLLQMEVQNTMQQGEQRAPTKRGNYNRRHDRDARGYSEECNVTGIQRGCEGVCKGDTAGIQGGCNEATEVVQWGCHGDAAGIK